MVDEAAKWLKLLESRDERIVLAAMQYLTDRSDGKARQSVDVDIDDKRKTGSERLKEFIAQAAVIAVSSLTPTKQSELADLIELGSKTRTMPKV